MQVIRHLADGSIETPELLIDPVTGAKVRKDKLVHGYVSTNIYSTKDSGSRFNPNLLTNGGPDFMHAQVYTNSSAGTIGANYIAVPENATLASEITTNGLARALVTASSGTVTYTASSSGTLVHEATFTSAALADGDKLQIVYTLN